MTDETYPCYVKVADDFDEVVEIPTEADGSMMLTSVKAQFPEAVGLRFKSDAGLWRGVRVNGNILDPPIEGWGETDYFIVLAKTGIKRTNDEFTGPAAKLAKMTQKEILSDMIVLGLPYAATDEDLKHHFSQFGELAACEIKYDSNKKSRGFAFLRYKTVEAVVAALNGTHILHKRRCELRYPKQEKDNIATKLFIGRLPKGTTTEDLRDHFCQYGVLKDVYIPQPFKGFGFVTYGSEADANTVLSLSHMLKGVNLNVTHPTEKKMENMLQGNNMGPDFMIQGSFMQNNMRGSGGNMGPGGNIGGNMGHGGNMGGLGPGNGNVGLGGKMQQNSNTTGYGYGYGSGPFGGMNSSLNSFYQAGKTSSSNYVWNGGKS